MPRAAEAAEDPALAAALEQLRSQTTAAELRAALAYLVARAAALRDDAGGAGGAPLPRSADFNSVIGRFAAVLPCLAALGYEPGGEGEFVLPEAPRPDDAGALAEQLQEWQLAQCDAAPGSPPRSTLGDLLTNLRDSFAGGGGAGGDLADPLLRTTSGLQRTRSASALVRGFSSRLSRQLSNGNVEEEFSCPICLCNETVAHSFTLSCGHRFCRDCLSGYVASRIADGQLEMTCPDLNSSAPVGQAAPAPAADGEGEGDTDSCPQPIERPVLLFLSTSETREKFERFSAMRQNALLRECPRAGCGALVEPTKNWRGVVAADMTCGDCGEAFCYYHSNAHPGQTCRAYEQAKRDEERAARAAIARLTKPCPKCGTPTEKNNGCNHMTCMAVNADGGRCRQDWCWICGRKCGGGGAYPTQCVVESLRLPRHPDAGRVPALGLLRAVVAALPPAALQASAAGRAYCHCAPRPRPGDRLPAWIGTLASRTATFSGSADQFVCCEGGVAPDLLLLPRRRRVTVGRSGGSNAVHAVLADNRAAGAGAWAERAHNGAGVRGPRLDRLCPVAADLQALLRQR